ncbi:MAG: stress response protein [Chloroflexi bacterium]|nr:stress response protein [Chloroflexota bacterium]
MRDERWPVARLIPITSATGVEAKERNAASALLAVLSVVDEFGRALLKPLGAPDGRIEAFVEVPFKIDGGRTIRPDGLIVVTRGARVWSALVECKIAGQPLVAEQMESYLDLARAQSLDAVLSISNQYTTKSSQYPIEIDRKKLRRVAIHHWSWVEVLTEAEVQKQHRGVRDRDQAYILGELIRYLSDPRSGVVQFDDMGPSWTAARDGARLRTLRKGDSHVAAVASRWDELVRYVSLGLTKDLGRDVKEVLRREEATPGGRQQALRESLATTGRLYAELQIPNTAGSLLVVADLASRQVSVSTQLDAPKEGQSRGRVSWLLRQLQKAPPNTTVEAMISRSSATLTAQLGAVRDNPALLLPEKPREIRGFRLSVTRDMGVNRAAGRGSFIDSVVIATTSFYGEVLQNLSGWKARPPKLKQLEGPVEQQEIELPQAIDEALERAEEEAPGPGIVAGSDR